MQWDHWTELTLAKTFQAHPFPRPCLKARSEYTIPVRQGAPPLMDSQLRELSPSPMRQSQVKQRKEQGAAMKLEWWKHLLCCLMIQGRPRMGWNELKMSLGWDEGETTDLHPTLLVGTT